MKKEDYLIERRIDGYVIMVRMLKDKGFMFGHPSFKWMRCNTEGLPTTWGKPLEPFDTLEEAKEQINEFVNNFE